MSAARGLPFSAAMMALLPLVVASLGGCVTVYQPLVGLQRPTVIDFQQDNFAGQKILVRCLPQDNLNRNQAQVLCRKISTLFSNQGADVQTLVPSERDTGDAEAAERLPDLTIDTKVRLVSEQSSLLLGIASVWTFTLVPNVGEYTFAHDVIIRDREGFALATATLQARFIRYFGLGVWGVNGLLDWLVRSDDEKLGGNVAQQDFSRDLYRQLSQLTFTAMMRSRVMHSFADAPAAAPPAKEQP
ncbi:MAG: hypothetical protein SF187_10115 [Deltaproteobacteria bacterium]|nr:hypothetical protein [Deltaproteobacteria bacterium]